MTDNEHVKALRSIVSGGLPFGEAMTVALASITALEQELTRLRADREALVRRVVERCAQKVESMAQFPMASSVILGRAPDELRALLPELLKEVGDEN